MMTAIKIYKDSKEFPLENFERIESTGNYFYMIKGYDDGDEINISIEDVESKYKELVQEYVISLNSKNIDIVNIAKLTQKKADSNVLIILHTMVTTKIRANDICEKYGLEIDNSDIFDAISKIQMKKSNDLNEVLSIIKDRIERIENEISEIESKMDKIDTSNEKIDINIIITNVENILERSINLKNVSLYRFGIMQEQAKKKIESLNKMQKK